MAKEPLTDVLDSIPFPNAFFHVYDPHSPIKPTPTKQKYARGGFGTKGGTIPGMGSQHEQSIAPRPSGLTIKPKK